MLFPLLFFFIFKACGVVLLLAGFYLLADVPRILLSRLLGAGSERLTELQHPLFYYIAVGLALAGIVAICASLIGWWAACLNTYRFFSFVST